MCGADACSGCGGRRCRSGGTTLGGGVFVAPAVGSVSVRLLRRYSSLGLGRTRISCSTNCLPRSRTPGLQLVFIPCYFHTSIRRHDLVDLRSFLFPVISGRCVKDISSGLLYACQNVLEVTQSLVATPGMCLAQNVYVVFILPCPAGGLSVHRTPVKDATGMLENPDLVECLLSLANLNTDHCPSQEP
jgi:hypothetical protein